MLSPSRPAGSPAPAPRQPAAPPARLRRSLSAPALAIHCSGQPEAAARLREALAVPPMPGELSAEERAPVEAALATHLFHSFAARTHPLLVRQLLTDLTPGQAVLDPFCGSGTVPLEVLLRGGRAIGCDVNELAVRLGRFKATALPPAMQRALLAKAQAVGAASLERVHKRQRPRQQWDEPAFYAPHVYLELCGLREELEQVVRSDAPLGEALLLILSSLIIKLSTQRAESRPGEVAPARHLGKGLPTRWFVRKAEEVCRLHAALWQRLPSPPPPPPLLAVADARVALGSDPRDRHATLGLWAGSLDRVITSPPYLGTYDYAAHHARRYAWLGIDPTPIERGEMAARRHGEALPLPELARRHQADCSAWVDAVARLLKPTGRLYVLVGDSVVGDQFIDGAEPLLRAAAAARLTLVARAAAERPHYLRSHAELPPRYEHLLHFERA
ncbi:MAG TPA: DNA methyltransferase [Pseudomonadota bacterium]|nr:DNA methyltransferase [Pseudomonadota bacterium]